MRSSYPTGPFSIFQTSKFQFFFWNLKKQVPIQGILSTRTKHCPINGWSASVPPDQGAPNRRVLCRKSSLEVELGRHVRNRRQLSPNVRLQTWTKGKMLFFAKKLNQTLDLLAWAKVPWRWGWREWHSPYKCARCTNNLSLRNVGGWTWTHFKCSNGQKPITLCALLFRNRIEL